jgi:hypothetical protein
LSIVPGIPGAVFYLHAHRKLGFIVLTHEMQNAECKMQNYDSLPFLHGNEPGEPNGVEIFAGLKARGVSGDPPIN